MEDVEGMIKILYSRIIEMHTKNFTYILYNVLPLLRDINRSAFKVAEIMAKCGKKFCEKSIVKKLNAEQRSMNKTIYKAKTDALLQIFIYCRNKNINVVIQRKPKSKLPVAYITRKYSFHLDDEICKQLKEHNLFDYFLKKQTTDDTTVTK